MVGWVDTLGWSWADSTLATYRSHLVAFRDYATAGREHVDSRVLVQALLQQRVASGYAASTMRCSLSALHCAFLLGLLPWDVPAPWWRVSISTARLGVKPARPRCWFPLESLFECAANITSWDLACAYAVVVVALALGLRFAEAARLGPGDFDARGGVVLHPAKLRPGVHTQCWRLLPPHPRWWAREFLCSRPGGGSSVGPFFTATALRALFGALQQGTGAASMGFHALRRATARGKSIQGHSCGSIAEWCRWTSLDTAEHYIGQHAGAGAPAFVLPVAPAQPVPAGPFLSGVTAGTLEDLFPPVENRGGVAGRRKGARKRTRSPRRGVPPQ